MVAADPRELLEGPGESGPETDGFTAVRTPHCGPRNHTAALGAAEQQSIRSVTVVHALGPLLASAFPLPTQAF
jgi:hypothetical protein